MRLIDTHCHLYDSEAFSNPATALEEARRVGVDQVIVIGTNLETSRAAVGLGERFAGIFAAVGWHPNCAADYSPSALSELKALAQNPVCVAIGETGLDFHWDYATREQQERCLLDQLALASDLKKPLVFHCREAYPALLDILEDRKPGPHVFHCFAGNAADARRCQDLGAYFGIDGPITYPKADDLREVVKSLPRDRVILETDAPYLSPHPHRGEKNRPALLPLIAERLAQVWEISTDEVAEITTANARRLFFSHV